MIILKNKSVEDNIENESLAAHVALCRQRESSQSRRMSNMEIRQDEIESRERLLKTFLLKTVTGASFAIISSVASISYVVFEFLKK